ncbi:hypothetical protein CAPTEDRAFT_183518 [Capitella teleta]|uniref:Peptidyl-tRNA hydrolase n=1 Tax=Capitella teleta TaxID=283909 RepID=R7TUG5_CAPTE|nr:hypothetical protein CAPTEDRAFT_183518 [Capitella teleta]|eukprot:ELT97558.1 hypothetical protein CAPTEDRAFT_183518 [Capitella teleta]
MLLTCRICHRIVSVMKPNSRANQSSSSPGATTGKDEERFLIVGLGNLHGGYGNTRHSVGIMLVDHLAQLLSSSPWKREGTALLSHSKLSVQSDCNKEPTKINLMLLKPRLPMNINGKSVQPIAQAHGIHTENIYLLQDDLDAKITKFRIKESGSANGHKGVLSCQNSFKSKGMPRLLYGIGRPASRDDVVDYVLSAFTSEEKDLVLRTFNPALELLLNHLGKKCNVVGLSKSLLG